MDTLESYLSKQKEPRSTTSSPRRLRDTAYVRLKDAIQHAALQPGQPLSETYLSKILGISRTPVREALQQLAQEGLVQVIPGRAVTVAAPSVQNVLNLIHVRSVLEPEVVRLVAEIAPVAVIESLRATLVKMQRAAEANDRVAWSRADTEWHETLGRACPNSLLAELTLQMRNRAHAISIDGQTSQSRLITCTTEHQRVVEAIAAHDTRAAEEAMRQHIFELRESMFRRLTHS